MEQEDVIRVAHEALVRCFPRCRDSEPAGPCLLLCITGVLEHHLRDRIRLLRIPVGSMRSAPSPSTTEP